MVAFHRAFIVCNDGLTDDYDRLPHIHCNACATVLTFTRVKKNEIMKSFKNLLFVFAALIAFSTTAQTSQGNMLAGGNIGVTTTSIDANDIKSTTLSLSPEFGYFISDGLAVGAILSLNSTSISNGTDQTFTTFGIGPFARYYMFTSNEAFAFFAQGSLIFSSTKQETGPTITKSSAVIFAIAPGFAYFFNEHWALQLQLAGISFQSTDPNKDVGNDKQTTFSIGVSSLSPNLGFRYHF